MWGYLGWSVFVWGGRGCMCVCVCVCWGGFSLRRAGGHGPPDPGDAAGEQAATRAATSRNKSRNKPQQAPQHAATSRNKPQQAPQHAAAGDADRAQGPGRRGRRASVGRVDGPAAPPVWSQPLVTSPPVTRRHRPAGATGQPAARRLPRLIYKFKTKQTASSSVASRVPCLSSRARRLPRLAVRHYGRRDSAAGSPATGPSQAVPSRGAGGRAGGGGGMPGREGLAG